MPNNCLFEMKVRGKQNAIEEFLHILKESCAYFPDKKYDTTRHFNHIIEIESEWFDSYNTQDKSEVYIFGDCGWSVLSAMCKTQSDKSITTLQQESDSLQLYIEVYSREPGNCFMEHYIYDNGKCLADDTVEWYEIWTEDYDTVEDINKEYGTHFTQEEFDNAEDGRLDVGGMEWVWS